MKRIGLILGLLAMTAVAFLAIGGTETMKAEGPDWSFNATVIEACSCPVFCQCYFNNEPAAHGGHEGHGGDHFCRFNNAFHVNKGHYGDTKLDGANFWVAGDLGADLASGEMKWAIMTFDPSVTPEQRAGIGTIVGHVYPVKWKSFAMAADAPIEWKASKDGAVARIDGGKTAEVVLKRFQGMSDEPVVIRNLKYWGVPRNDGFVVMPNEVEAYRAGENAFEFKGTNGFLITLDMTAKDLMGGM